MTLQSDIYLIFHSQHKTTAPQAAQFSCSRTHLPNKSHSSCLVTQLPPVSSWDVPVPLAVVKVLLVTQQGRWVLELRGEIWLAPHGVQCLSPAHDYSVCSGTLGQGHSCNVFHKLTAKHNTLKTALLCSLIVSRSTVIMRMMMIMIIIIIIIIIII